MGAPVDYKALIGQTAIRYGVPPAIAIAVAQQESGIRQWDSSGAVIRGGSGEVGMFQLMPGTAAEVGVDPFDVNQNIEGGIRYLKKMYGVAGSWPGALIAYNGGPGTYESGGAGGYAQSYADATAYSQQVMARAGILQYTTEPGRMVAVPPQTSPGFNDWLSMYGAQSAQDPVYATGTVFSTDVVADASNRLVLLLLAAAAVTAVVVSA